MYTDEVLGRLHAASAQLHRQQTIHAALDLKANRKGRGEKARGRIRA